MKKFNNSIPARTIIYLMAAWLVLAVINISLKKAGLYVDTPSYFPISVFYGPSLHFSGIPYLLLFIAVLAYAIKLAPKFSQYQVWCIGFLLIILGNLGQGDWDSSFNKPFYAGGSQYYSDAIKISSWSGWLASFNADQRTLLMHSQTHPPFAVLIHYFFLSMSGNSVLFLSMIFVFLSSISILLLWKIFRILSLPIENRNLLALLFSVIPAVNIYTAVSLDGLILTGATMWLLGMILLLKSGKISIAALLLISIGIIVVNLLTYVGISLFAVASALAVWEYIVHKKFTVIASLLISFVIFMTVMAILNSGYGYDHRYGFLTASSIENPEGFRGFREPFTYVATRVEDVCEIALFLSVGLLAILFHPKKLGISYSDWQNRENGIMMSGICTLIVVFLFGAFHTGETARSALFIYPYIFLALRNAEPALLKNILNIAAVQTLAMQLFGSYFW